MKGLIIVSTIFLLGFLIDNCHPQENSDNEIKVDVNNDLETWEAPDDIKRRYPYYQAGFDNENRPVWVNEFGKWDIKRLVESGETAVFDKYTDQFLYRVQKSISIRSTPDDPVTSWVYIFDMEEYPLSQLNSLRTVSYIVTLARKVELAARNMEYGFILNLNFLGEQLIRVLRPVLGTTLDRAEIAGTNKAKWMPLLLKSISKDQLPEWYGGLSNQTYTAYAVYG